MRTCRGCHAEIGKDARFCPNCGRDQTVLFPDAVVPEGVPPPQPNSISTEHANVRVPPAPIRQTGTVGAGFGWAAGGCLFWVLLTVGFFLLSGLLFVGCFLVVGASGA